MSAPLLTTRDALAKALCAWWDGESTDSDQPCEECLVEADAVLTSGAVVDADSLVDDEALISRMCRAPLGGWTQGDVVENCLRALAAALAERGPR